MDNHWTDEVDEESKGLFASLSTAEIRKRQSLCSQQIEIAHKQGNTRALEDLRRMENALTREMLTRC